MNFLFSFFFKYFNTFTLIFQKNIGFLKYYLDKFGQKVD